MFRADLKEKLETIFALGKTTFDLPSPDAPEQECIFVEVDVAQCRKTDKRQIAKVSGKIRVYAQAGKLPYGFFSKRISEADPDLTKHLYFYDFEENRGTLQNVDERSCGFLFLFESQYDPNLGTLTSVETDIEYAES